MEDSGHFIMSAMHEVLKNDSLSIISRGSVGVGMKLETGAWQQCKCI